MSFHDGNTFGFDGPFGPLGRRRILVAGGAGFLGSHLCERLLNTGFNVICVDNFLTGNPDNIAPWRSHPRFQLISHDIVHKLAIDGPIDQVYNLACPASPPLYQRDPMHTLRTCFEGTINLLDIAHAKGARFFQASTSEVYGDPEFSPQPESYRGSVNTFGPRACYDEGKRVAETICYEYGHKLGVDVRVVRIFNTYGPRMDPKDGRVVSNFICQALRGQDITIYGSGLQTRSFCYVDDLIDGFLRLMASDEKQPVNIGNPGEFTMLELAEKVLAKTDSASRLVYCDLPVDDPRQRRPDIAQAQAILGWAPQVSLDEGLDRTIAWYKAKLSTQMERVAAVA